MTTRTQLSVSRLVLVVALASGPAARGAMIVDTATYGGHTYHLVANDSNQRITWSDAEAYAVTLGGHLVTIDDAAENAFVLGAFGAQAASLSPAGGGLVALWLGLNDAASEGTYSWASGGSSSYTNFAPGQPQNGPPDEDYVAMLVQGGDAGRWHDVLSDFRANDVTFGVVEIAPAVPEPTALALASTGALLVAAGARRRGRPRTA